MSLLELLTSSKEKGKEEQRENKTALEQSQDGNL